MATDSTSKIAARRREAEDSVLLHFRAWWPHLFNGDADMARLRRELLDMFRPYIEHKANPERK